MQTSFHAVCYKQNISLKEAIRFDIENLFLYNLCVEKRKRGEDVEDIRVFSTKAHGTITVKWGKNMLFLTVSTRGNGKPFKIIGLFIEYLLTHHKGKIKTIILP